MQTKLFQPLTIGPREARNRIIFGSHTTNFARHNRLSRRHSEYYARRAEGGAGIIVLEEHIVHPSDMPYENAVLGYLPGTPAAIADVVERIHAQGREILRFAQDDRREQDDRHEQDDRREAFSAEGPYALAIVQLNHNGQQSTSDHNQRELWAPSAVPNVGSREVPKAMELADIQAVIEGFALVARHAVEGRADGVELQIADSSLLRQFLSLLTNQRTDQYGGVLENRLRFVQETIEAVDVILGSDNILGVRLCADELAPWAGLTPEQSIEIARVLGATGRVDYLTITMGSIFSTHMFPFHASMHTPPGYAAHLAAAIKAAVTIPVFAAGRIMNVAQAERLLAEEQADGVEMIRALIADPYLPLGAIMNVDKIVGQRLADKSAVGGEGIDTRSAGSAEAPTVLPEEFVHEHNWAPTQEGRASEVRPCISCNQGCQVRNVMNVQLSCNVNPDIVGARLIAPQGNAPFFASKTPTLHIIGGGPAGMEAARTAALRGRHVVLYERENQLGGAVALAAKGPGRSELALITDYLQAQLEKLGVEVHLGVEVAASVLLEQHPEAVLIATGARTGTGLLPIPGRDLPHVTDIRCILRG